MLEPKSRIYWTKSGDLPMRNAPDSEISSLIFELFACLKYDLLTCQRKLKTVTVQVLLAFAKTKRRRCPEEVNNDI